MRSNSLLILRMIMVVFLLLYFNLSLVEAQNADVQQIIAEIKSKHVEEKIKGIEKGSALTDKSGKPLLHPEILEVLIAALSDREADVQAAATRALRRFGPASAKAIPALIAQMKGTDGSSDEVFMWIDCSRTLTAIGPESIPHLIEAFDQGDENTYKGVCQTLHDLAPTLPDMLAEPVVKEMISRITKEKGQRRWAIAFVLKSLGTKAKPAVAGLTDALNDHDFQIRIMSCQALAAIGKPSKPAAKRLKELTQQGTVSDRGFAAIALGSIGIVEEVDTIKILVDLLEDSNQVVKERAMIGLARMGAAAKRALPEIEKAIKSDSFAAKPEAAMAHWRISGTKELAVQTLLPLLDDRVHELNAIESLGIMGIDANSAVNGLVKRAETEDISILIEISIALSKIKNSDPLVIELLSTLAESEDPELKEYASNALKKLKE